LGSIYGSADLGICLIVVPIIVRGRLVAAQAGGPVPAVAATRTTSTRGERVPFSAAARERRFRRSATVAHPATRKERSPETLRTSNAAERLIGVQAEGVEHDLRRRRIVLQQQRRAHRSPILCRSGRSRSSSIGYSQRILTCASPPSTSTVSSPMSLIIASRSV